MKTQRSIFTFIFLTVYFNINAQEILTRPAFAADSFSFKTVSLNSTNTPTVSIVFTTETKNGEALFGLTKEKILMSDGKKQCEILSLEQLSKVTALNIAIVIDHSSSMRTEYRRSNYYSKNAPANNYPANPALNISPIDSVKDAVINFVGGLDHTKDSVSIIGFASTVDIVLPLTRFTNTAISVVGAVKTGDATSMYDGIMEGIQEAAEGSGTKAVIVLTDGYDNTSKLSLKYVVREANNENIPVYCIGIGNADAYALKTIADQTGGVYFYANSTTEIQSVYTLIRKKIEAQYKVVARCNGISQNVSEKQLVLSFSKENQITQPNKTLMPVIKRNDKQTEKTEGDEPGR